jgi:hypothetical protein
MLGKSCSVGKQCYKVNVSVQFVTHVNQVGCSKNDDIVSTINPTGSKMGKNAEREQEMIDESLTSGKASLNRS